MTVLCPAVVAMVQEKSGEASGEKKRSADEIEAEAGPESPSVEKKKKKKKAKTEE